MLPLFVVLVIPKIPSFPPLLFKSPPVESLSIGKVVLMFSVFTVVMPVTIRPLVVVRPLTPNVVMVDTPVTLK